MTESKCLETIGQVNLIGPSESLSPHISNPELSRILVGGGGGVTQDVGSGTIGVKKCGKWDYRGEKMWEVGLSL